MWFWRNEATKPTCGGVNLMRNHGDILSQ